MIYTTLDTIVRRQLLAKRLPLHYYSEFLTHASTALRELSFDTLRLINTVRLTLDKTSAAYLPCDYVDWVAVGKPAGQFIQPIAQRDTITPLVNYNTQGQPIPYGAPSDEVTFWGLWNGWTWFWNIDDLGETTGRMYGMNTGNVTGFKVFKERGQIQLTENYCGDIVLQYISDGQCIDNATQVDVQAQAAIDAYVFWKRSPNADAKDSPEARTFAAEWRKLRARKNELTIPDLKNILYKNYRPGIAN